MFAKLRKFLKEKGITKDFFNLFLGILMAVALLVFSITKNSLTIGPVIILGALMNIVNGLAMIKKKEKKTMGMSMIFLGIIILFAFVYYAAGGYIK